MKEEKKSIKKELPVHNCDLFNSSRLDIGLVAELFLNLNEETKKKTIIIFVFASFHVTTIPMCIAQHIEFHCIFDSECLVFVFVYDILKCASIKHQALGIDH